MDLFSIKINQIWLNSIYFWFKDRNRLTKCQLFNRKRWLINWKRQFILKNTIYIKNNNVFNVIRPIFDKNRILILNPNPNSNRHDDLDGFKQWYCTWKHRLKLLRLQFKTNLNWRSIRSHWLNSQWLGHLPNLASPAHFAHFQGFIEYYTKGKVS